VGKFPDAFEKFGRTVFCIEKRSAISNQDTAATPAAICAWHQFAYPDAMHLSCKILVVPLAFLFAVAVDACAAEVTKIAPQAAAALVAADKAVLVDVREPAECAETGVAAVAVLLPKSDFDGEQKLWKPFLAQTGDKQIILYCRSGNRAGTVGAALAAQGRKVANAGGFKDWAAAGLPTRKVGLARPKP
jgi:rhodanese-related sulfurtransferase